MIIICLKVNSVNFRLPPFHLRKLEEIFFPSNLKIFQNAFQSTTKKFLESSRMVERVKHFYY
jgi:hypothetical protein